MTAHETNSGVSVPKMVPSGSEMTAFGTPASCPGADNRLTPSDAGHTARPSDAGHTARPSDAGHTARPSDAGHRTRRATRVTETAVVGRVMLIGGFTRPFRADSVAAWHGPRSTGGRFVGGTGQ